MNMLVDDPRYGLCEMDCNGHVVVRPRGHLPRTARPPRSPRRPAARDETQVAEHESAHALFAHYVSVPILRLSLFDPPQDNVAGACWTCWRDDAITVVEAIGLNLAGPAHDRLFHGMERSPTWNDDLRMARAFLDCNAESWDHDRLWAAGSRLADEIVTDFHGTIVRLAKRLIEKRTMSGEEVEWFLSPRGHADAAIR